MCFFISLLLYKKVWYVTTHVAVTHIEDFGFLMGGGMSVSVSSPSANKLLYIATNATLHKDLISSRDLYKQICAHPGNYSGSGVYNVSTLRPGDLERQIDSQQILYFKIVNCDFEKTPSISATAVHTFWNPTTRMDYRWIGVISAKKITVIALIILVSIWIVNWMFHFRVQIWIHYCFTVTFVIAVGLSVIRLFELIYLDGADTAPVLTPLRICMEVFTAVVFCVTLLLAAKGWCILRDEVSIRELVTSMSFTVLSIVLVTIGRYVSLASFEIVVWIAALVFVALFVRELIVSINDASLYIMAHLLAISNAGIEAQSTPIYLKHVMYQTLEWLIMIGFGLALVKMCAALFLEIEFWLSETLNDIIELIIAGALGYIFRIRDTAVSGYTNIDPATGNESEFELAEIAGLNVHSQELNRGGRKWEEGMPLPGMPSIVDSGKAPKQEEAADVVVLASPDGTNTINAQVTTGDEP